MPQAEKPDSTTTSRRRFLAAATAAAASVAATAGPALAANSLVTGVENPALVALGVEFERLFQIEREAWDAIPDDAPDSSWKPAALAQDEVHNVIEQIALLPALTMDGLRLKARTVAWCHGVGYGPGDEAVQYAQPSSTLDTRIVHSIIQDLMQRWSPPPADDEADHRSQRVSLMTADDQKATGFQHATWDMAKPIRAGDTVAILAALADFGESKNCLQLAVVLRAERRDGSLLVGLDGTPIDPSAYSGMARVVSMTRHV